VLRMLGMPGLNRIVAHALLPAASPDAAAEGFEVFGHPTETVEGLPRELGELQYLEHRLPTFALSWRSLGQDSFHRAGFGGWNPELEISAEDLAGIEHPTMLIWGDRRPLRRPGGGRRCRGASAPRRARGRRGRSPALAR
jgi:pimeloyl-ACP methyl ester carboxylesterase